jgi:Na+-driven multidrug efflux pump
MVRYGAALMLMVGLFGLLLVLNGTRITAWTVGESFTEYDNMLLPLAVGLLGTSWSYAGAVGLRSTAAGKQLATGELVAAGVQVALVSVLVQSHGVLGAAWGSTATAFVHAALMWSMYWRSRRRSGATSGQVDPVSIIRGSASG